MKVPFLIGRILFGSFFVYNGLNHLRNRHMMAHYAAEKHVPKPEAGVVLTGAMMIAGGTSMPIAVPAAIRNEDFLLTRMKYPRASPIDITAVMLTAV